MPVQSLSTEAAVLHELSRLGFPPFDLVLKTKQDARASGRAARRVRADAEIELSWGGKRERFLVECKAVATPMQVESALAQLRQLTDSGTASRMLVAPYLASGTLERLAREGVSGIDLAGNGVVTVPGRWFVLRTGNDNPYPASSPIKNVYRGRSSLVCRALLLRRGYPSVGALVKRLSGTGVTQATVSKVIKALEEELIVDRAPAAAGARGIRLAQPAELLDRLVANYRPPRPTRVLRGVPAADDPRRTPAAVITALAERAGVRVAVDMVAPYAPFPGNAELPIYVESLAPVLDAAAIREDDRFATIRLVETDDPTAYFDARRFGEMCCVSPMQAYLELATGTKRDREIAEVVRARVLKEAERADESAAPPATST